VQEGASELVHPEAVMAFNGTVDTVDAVQLPDLGGVPGRPANGINRLTA
jgi:hypothetical protein